VSDDWRIQNSQVPLWTDEGELSFAVEETMPPRTPGGREYPVTGELLVPLILLPPSFLGPVITGTVERKMQESQQLMADAGLAGAVAVGLRKIGKMATSANPLLSGGRGEDLADTGYVRIDLFVGDGVTGRRGDGYLRLTPFPLTGEVRAGVRRVPLPNPS
jgi:hypothetical protein